MSNFRKKAIALAAVVCVALTSFASCSGSDSKNNKTDNGTTSAKETSDNSDSSAPTLEKIENENGNVVVTPFQFGSASDLGITAPDADVALNSDDPVSTTSAEPATEFVTVTDDKGEKVTDAKGEPVTETVTKADSGDKEYVSKTDSRYCLWVDISKDSDYIFNDEFIDVYFKLKDNIPEKDYAVRFNPDFSSIEGVSRHPDKVVQGSIRVGGEIEPIDVSSETGFVAYGENISAKAGDEVVYRINLKNNPGLAGILVWIYFDSNAMEIEDVIPSGEFAKFAGSATTGSKPKS